MKCVSLGPYYQCDPTESEKSENIVLSFSFRFLWSIGPFSLVQRRFNVTSSIFYIYVGVFDSFKNIVQMEIY